MGVGCSLLPFCLSFALCVKLVDPLLHVGSLEMRRCVLDWDSVEGVELSFTL